MFNRWRCFSPIVRFWTNYGSLNCSFDDSAVLRIYRIAAYPRNGIVQIVTINSFVISQMAVLWNKSDKKLPLFSKINTYKNPKIIPNQLVEKILKTSNSIQKKTANISLVAFLLEFEYFPHFSFTPLHFRLSVPPLANGISR